MPARPTKSLRTAPSRTTTTKRTTKTAQPTPASVAVPPATTIPPQVAALAMFAAPGYHEVPHDFREAWAEMAAIVAALMAGTSDALGSPSRDTCARRMFEADVASARATGDDDKLAAAVDILNAFDRDALGALEYHLGEPAFYTGLAMGLYLLTVGGAR